MRGGGRFSVVLLDGIIKLDKNSGHRGTPGAASVEHSPVQQAGNDFLP